MGHRGYHMTNTQTSGAEGYRFEPYRAYQAHQQFPCRPSGLGMYTRRRGFARYAPHFKGAERSLMFSSSCSPYSRHVLPSTAAAAIPLEAEVGPAERVQAVYVVHERREPYLLVLPSDPTIDSFIRYTSQVVSRRFFHSGSTRPETSLTHWSS